MKIIAELGCNGKNIDEYREMIKACRDNSIDFVKLQLFNKEVALRANIPERLSFSYEDALELFEYGQSIHQEVFFTCCDLERIEWCEEIGVHYYKIRCADNNKSQLREKIRKTLKPYFISFEMEDSTKLFRNDNAKFLCCVPKYPAPMRSYNLAQILLSKFNGISDHTSDLRLLKQSNKIFSDYFYFEKHMKLREDCIETQWSVFINDVGRILK